MTDKSRGAVPTDRDSAEPCERSQLHAALAAPATVTPNLRQMHRTLPAGPYVSAEIANTRDCHHPAKQTASHRRNGIQQERPRRGRGLPLLNSKVAAQVTTPADAGGNPIATNASMTQPPIKERQSQPQPEQRGLSASDLMHLQ